MLNVSIWKISKFEGFNFDIVSKLKVSTWKCKNLKVSVLVVSAVLRIHYSE